MKIILEEVQIICLGAKEFSKVWRFYWEYAINMDM